MARRGKRLFDSYKRRGEWAELLFMTVASGRGFNIAKPWGESHATTSPSNKMAAFSASRSNPLRCGWGHVTCASSTPLVHCAYNPKEIDFYAIYVLPVDVWVHLPR